MDCSLPGSSVHEILEARILKWVAISFSRGSSQPRDQTCVSCISCIAGGFLTTGLPGKSLGFVLFLNTHTHTHTHIHILLKHLRTLVGLGDDEWADIAPSFGKKFLSCEDKFKSSDPKWEAA